MTDAITAMAHGAADTEARLRAAVQAAPCAAVLRAALAWHLTSTGRDTEARDHIDAARAARAALSRRDRHTVDIVTAAAERSAGRATGLAAEHLREYPDDQLVRFVAAGLAARPGTGPSGASGAAAP
jgi:hypothetical protein